MTCRRWHVPVGPKSLRAGDVGLRRHRHSHRGGKGGFGAARRAAQRSISISGNHADRAWLWRGGGSETGYYPVSSCHELVVGWVTCRRRHVPVKLVPTCGGRRVATTKAFTPEMGTEASALRDGRRKGALASATDTQAAPGYGRTAVTIDRQHGLGEQWWLRLCGMAQQQNIFCRHASGRRRGGDGTT